MTCRFYILNKKNFLNTIDVLIIYLFKEIK